MRSVKTEGIVIKRKNYGEADRLVTVFTKDFGKITVKAGGVRRITSRRSSHIELLNLSEIYLYKGRSYFTLTEAIVMKNFLAIKDNLVTIGFAYHICELIDGLCAENQENEKVFHLLKNTLSKLVAITESGKEDDLVSTVHAFEVDLLIMLGFWHVPEGIPTKRVNIHSIIENLLERKLKSKQIILQIKN